MALISCRECNAQISEKAVTCPQCGGQTKFAESWENWWLLFVILLALVILGPLFYYGYKIWETNPFR